MSLNSTKHHSFAILPTLVGFAAAQVTGFLWYGPLFGNQWRKAMKESRPDFDVAKNGSSTVLAGAAAMWLTSSICFTTMVEFWDRKGDRFSDYLCLAHTAWLGFSLPGHVFATLFADQHKTIGVLDAAYSLTAFTLMATAHWLL